MSHPMASADRPPSSSVASLPPVDPVPPAWVQDAIGSSATSVQAGGNLSITASGDLALLTAVVEDVKCLPVETLRGQVAETYRHVGAALAATGRHAIRYWNFIPGIGEELEPGLDRYMVFNAGRYETLASSSAVPESGRTVATASAVGCGGTRLVVYCLASSQAGTPIENPRQTSPWLYSARYGPLPPWFSRATRATINGVPQLLIGGTASIVGEDSRHALDAAGQLGETLENLAALIGAATPGHTASGQALAQLVDLRAYVTDDRNASIVGHEIERRCPRARRKEIVRASLCRPELLLEIEAVAEL
jgi:chorismate lyase/3-hydroxybenzoate synthase